MGALSEAKRQGAHCSAAELGPFQELERHADCLPGAPASVESKLFLNQLLGLTGTEISINKMPAGREMPFHHRHRLNEEVYIFLSGQGEFQVDGIAFPVREGSVVRVASNGERSWRNTGSADLLYIVVQAREGSYKGHTFMDGIPVDKSA